MDIRKWISAYLRKGSHRGTYVTVSDWFPPPEPVYLGEILHNVKFFGIVSDFDSPEMFSATLEISGDPGLLTLPALAPPIDPLYPGPDYDEQTVDQLLGMVR